MVSGQTHSRSGTLTLLGSGVQFTAGTNSFYDGAVINGTLNQSGGTFSFSNATVNNTYNLSGGAVGIATGKQAEKMLQMAPAFDNGTLPQGTINDNAGA